MKIISSNGCINYGLTIGEDNFNDLSSEDKKEVALKVIEFLEKEDDWGLIRNLISDVADLYGEETASGYCEQCNDTWDENTLEI